MHIKKRIYKRPHVPKSHLGMGEMLAFLLVAGAMGAAWYYWDIHRRNEELTAGQSELSEARASVAEMRKRVDARRLEVGELQGKATLFDTLGQQKSALGTQITGAEQELTSQRAQLAAAVQGVRLKAAGTMLPELRLVDDKVLTDVRILSVSDSDISVAHAGGMARVPAKKLPPEFQERFRFGRDVVAATGAAEAPPSSVPAPPPAADTGASVPEAGPARLNESQRQKVAELNAALASKKSRLWALEQMMARRGTTERPDRPKTLSSDPEQVRRQIERARSRQFEEQRVKNSINAAALNEMSALQEQIVAIQTEIAGIYQVNPR